MSRGTLKVVRYEDGQITVRRKGDGVPRVTLSPAEALELGRKLVKWTEKKGNGTTTPIIHRNNNPHR